MSKNRHRAWWEKLTAIELGLITALVAIAILASLGAAA
jgi:hypothetical protein